MRPADSAENNKFLELRTYKAGSEEIKFWKSYEEDKTEFSIKYNQKLQIYIDAKIKQNRLDSIFLKVTMLK